MADDESSKNIDKLIWEEIKLNNKEAERILQEAYIIARWAKNPFYIS